MTFQANAQEPIADPAQSETVEETASEVPQILHYEEPLWPESELETGKEATIGLYLTVNPQGLVESVEVVQSGGEVFDQAATAAALKLRFQPALQEDGEPISQIIEFHYRFTQEVRVDEENEVEESPEVELPPVLTGEVLSMGNRKPMAALEVLFTDSEGVQLSSITDEQGRYQFQTVATGKGRIEVLHYGFGSARKIEILENETAEVRLWVRLDEGAMDEMVIVYETPPAPEITRRSIGVEEIKKVPGTFGDPVRVIQNLPGAARSPFGTGFLVIRGANPEDSAVSVDGIRVPLIYHLGGYVSIINADLIDSVDYLPGGYSTRYGRSMGGVIDVKSRDEFSEQPRLTWSTDLLDSGGLFEGRVGSEDQIGVAVAARRSYIDQFIPLFTKNSGFSILPRWYDYQLKVADLSDRDHDLSLFAFGFGDTMLIHTADDVAQGTGQTSQGDVDLAYGTHRVVLRWLKPLGEGRELLIQPSIGVDTSEFTLGDEWRFAVRQTYIIMRAEMPWKLSPAVKLTSGLDFMGGTYEVDFLLGYSPDALASSDPLAEAESWTSGFDGWGWSPDPWLDLQIRPFEERDKLILIPGIRLSTFLVKDTPMMWGLDPRFQARWEVFPGGVLKGGSGIYQQPPIGPDLGFDETKITVDYEYAWASEVGWEQEIGLALSADITFFYKEMNNLIIENDAFGATVDAAPFVNLGEGLVQGMEIMVRRAPVDQFFGWLSYTLSKSERRDDPTDPDGWYSFDFDQTHIFTGVGGIDLPRDRSISGRVQYVTGNPYTPYDTGIYDLDQDSYLGFATGPRNGERMPPYYAVDFRIDKLRTFKHWQLETYLDILNAVHGINPEGVRYSYDYTESTFVKGLPFIPSPGFEARVFF
jgi:TonB family protein